MHILEPLKYISNMLLLLLLYINHLCVSCSAYTFFRLSWNNPTGQGRNLPPRVVRRSIFGEGTVEKSLFESIASQVLQENLR